MLDRATTLTLIEASISKPWHDSMEPLLEFVKVMGGQEGSFALPSKDAAEEFANLSFILQATEESPMKVIRALKAIDETASAEKMVLATFKALPQGTKLIELARDFASKKLKAVHSLQEIDAVQVDCAAHLEVLKNGIDEDGSFNESTDLNHAVDEVARLADALAAVKSKEPWLCCAITIVIRIIIMQHASLLYIKLLHCHESLSFMSFSKYSITTIINHHQSLTIMNHESS